MAYFITESCTGCTACARVCPTSAISGVRQQRHTIDPAVCVACGVCGRVCPAGAVLDEAQQPCQMIKRSAWARPVVNPRRCVSCGACVETCPTQALAWNDEPGHPAHLLPVLQEEKNCIACSFCADTCPVEAITMQLPVALPAGGAAGKVH
jgi:ferredoxin